MKQDIGILWTNNALLPKQRDVIGPCIDNSFVIDIISSDASQMTLLKLEKLHLNRSKHRKAQRRKIKRQEVQLSKKI